MNSKQIKDEHIKKFRNICKNMQKLMNEITDYCPQANIYIEGDSNWNLMNGDSHDHISCNDDVDRQDRVVASEIVRPSGGGGW